MYLGSAPEPFSGGEFGEERFLWFVMSNFAATLEFFGRTVSTLDKTTSVSIDAFWNAGYAF
jgi:hypothetical protein